ncbi:hypothetical protein MPER_03833, partial [Moniliophthora perniciosa FA553]
CKKKSRGSRLKFRTIYGGNAQSPTASTNSIGSGSRTGCGFTSTATCLWKRRMILVFLFSQEQNVAGEAARLPFNPIFREGSKGYLCCKRRVLEFDEFLKIKGCKTGRHVFASKTNLE